MGLFLLGCFLAASILYTLGQIVRGDRRLYVDEPPERAEPGCGFPVTTRSCAPAPAASSTHPGGRDVGR